MVLCEGPVGPGWKKLLSLRQARGTSTQFEMKLRSPPPPFVVGVQQPRERAHAVDNILRQLAHQKVIIHRFSSTPSGAEWILFMHSSGRMIHHYQTHSLSCRLRGLHPAQFLSPRSQNTVDG